MRDVAVETITRAEQADAVLACADGALRVCGAGPPVLELATASGDTAAAAASSSSGGGSSGGAALSCVEAHATPMEVEMLASGGAMAAAGGAGARWRHLVWGSDGGQCGEALADSGAMRRGWLLPNAGAHRGGGVTALWAGSDLTGDGAADVVVGRDDGAVQVFAVEAGAGTTAAPVMAFSHAAGESIRSLGGGCLSSPDHAEAVFQAYGGRVVSLTTESLGSRDAEDRYGRTKAAVQKEARVKVLREELAELAEQTRAAELLLGEEASTSGVDIADLGITGRKETAGGLAGGGAATVAKAAVDRLRRELGDGAAVAVAPAGAESAQLTKSFDVTATFALEPADAAYRLSVEAPVPIDMVLLESDVSLDLLASGDDAGAILTQTPCDPEAAAAGTGPRVLATYRCQEPSTRVEARLRSVEGQAGDIRLVVVAKGEPATAQAASVTVRPLSMHYRLPGGRAEAAAAAQASWGQGDVAKAAAAPKRRSTEGEEEAELADDDAEADDAAGAAAAEPSEPAPAPALSRMVVTGDFTAAMAHAWVVSCVHDAPARPDPSRRDGRCEIAFRSSLLGGVLVVTYGDGQATFESDAVTTLAIVKEVVMADATRAGATVSTRFEPGPSALPRSLGLIRGSLERALGLSRRAELFGAVKEVTQGEEDLGFLSPELRDVLEHGEEYRRELRGRPRLLELLFGVVTDCFVDWHRFRGRDVTAAIPALAERLRAYEFGALVRFVSDPA